MLVYKIYFDFKGVLCLVSLLKITSKQSLMASNTTFPKFQTYVIVKFLL